VERRLFIKYGASIKYVRTEGSAKAYQTVREGGWRQSVCTVRCVFGSAVICLICVDYSAAL
jgi:hypothetical protein